MKCEINERNKKQKGLCGVPESLINALSRTDNTDFVVVSNEGGVHNHGLDVLLEMKKVNWIIMRQYAHISKQDGSKFLVYVLHAHINPWNPKFSGI